jgi:serine protease AprX
VTNWRKQLAGTLTASICLGLTATVAAAPANGKRQADGRQHRLERASSFDGQQAPDYDRRKPTDDPKLDRTLNDRADKGGVATSRVIVTLKPGMDVDDLVAKLGGKRGRKLNLISGQVVELPNFVLRKLANSPAVASIHHDRETSGEMNRAAVVEGARAVQEEYGLDGAGVGVAIIDSGIAAWHDDLTYKGSNTKVKVVGGQRVTKFVDFVNGRLTAYDDNGHGTHVAGIIAGNGYDTYGARAGIAPAANLVSLKVLSDHGSGRISDVIAALDWVVANKAAYNIRVVNLSVGASITESYMTDPLTLAAKRCVDAGVVVVTAAGNLGKNVTTGKAQYGGITSPGNAPWVLTVGAYSHEGTINRNDDKIGGYSSRGPTAVDFGAKPDVVATGTGIVSLAVPGSAMYSMKAQYLLNGTVKTANKPYLSLTGTSMASPIVAGTAALMLQANPKLTPNLVKAIIEYTAQTYKYDTLTQGAGFLNTKGAVDLAKFLYTAKAGQRYPYNRSWSRTIVWGNRKLKNGVIKPAGTAWAPGTVWGAARTAEGDNIVWGTIARESDNIVWGTSAMDADNLVWGTFAREGDNIVWGTVKSELDNIVWGTACGMGAECDNIVWGTSCAGANCEEVVWGTSVAESELDNIVWGTQMEADNIVWGTNGEIDNIVWGTSSAEDEVPFDDPDTPGVFDGITFDSLFEEAPAPAPVDVTVPAPPVAILPATTSLTTTGSDPLAPVVGGGF